MCSAIHTLSFFKRSELKVRRGIWTCFPTLDWQESVIFPRLTWRNRLFARTRWVGICSSLERGRINFKMGRPNNRYLYKKYGKNIGKRKDLLNNPGGTFFRKSSPYKKSNRPTEGSSMKRLHFICPQQWGQINRTRFWSLRHFGVVPITRVSRRPGVRFSLDVRPAKFWNV